MGVLEVPLHEVNINNRYETFITRRSDIIDTCTWK